MSGTGALPLVVDPDRGQGAVADVNGLRDALIVIGWVAEPDGAADVPRELQRRAAQAFLATHAAAWRVAIDATGDGASADVTAGVLAARRELATLLA